MVMYFASAPATSGNLGPGFDKLGLAYDLRLEVRAKPAASWSVLTLGKGSDELPQDETNLIAATCIKERQRCGFPDRPLEIRVNNPIPVRGGLGSSATALACGLALAWLSAGKEPDREAIFQRASESEGHPDNAAPAIFGGLNLCGSSAEGFFAERGSLHPSIRVLLLTPDAHASTEAMRAALPASWPQEDLDWNEQQTAALLQGLADGQKSGLSCSQNDRLHQPYRFALQPEAKRLYDYLVNEPSVAGAFLSGSGPTVAGWITDPVETLPNYHTAVRSLNMAAATAVRLVDIDTKGLITRVEPK